MAEDKFLHFLTGMAITLVGSALSPFWALAGCALIAAAKELGWDLYLGRGTPEWLDFVATFAGGVAGVVGYVLLEGW